MFSYLNHARISEIEQKKKIDAPDPPPFGRAASVCLLSMTFLLGASRLALFTFEIHASIRWNWDPSSAWVASVSGVD